MRGGQTAKRHMHWTNSGTHSSYVKAKIARLRGSETYRQKAWLQLGKPWGSSKMLELHAMGNVFLVETECMKGSKHACSKTKVSVPEITPLSMQGVHSDD
eukprot:648137-Pelagomonas_calceolata.AAC.4